MVAHGSRSIVFQIDTPTSRGVDSMDSQYQEKCTTGLVERWIGKRFMSTLRRIEKVDFHTQQMLGKGIQTYNDR